MHTYMTELYKKDCFLYGSIIRWRIWRKNTLRNSGSEADTILKCFRVWRFSFLWTGHQHNKIICKLNKYFRIVQRVNYNNVSNIFTLKYCCYYSALGSSVIGWLWHIHDFRYIYICFEDSTFQFWHFIPHSYNRKPWQ